MCVFRIFDGLLHVCVCERYVYVTDLWHEFQKRTSLRNFFDDRGGRRIVYMENTDEHSVVITDIQEDNWNYLRRGKILISFCEAHLTELKFSMYRPGGRGKLDLRKRKT